MTVYNRVVFNRGTGLGNRLFPWARCVIASHERGEPMLAPRWWWPLRQGALFAGGINRRAYLRQGLLIGVFQPRPQEITGLVALRAHPVNTFRGEGNQFADVTGHRALLLQAFRDSTRARWLQLADASSDLVIGINVRRGRDFHDAAKPEDFQTQGGLRTPLDWFVGMLREARRIAGKRLPAIVVSDGTPDDLAQLLQEPDTRMLRPGCPASDMLVLAQSRLMLGSGGSSFSAWASFLGSVPVVTIPGQSLSWFKTEASGAYVGTADPADPGEDFAALCRAITP